MLWSFLEAVMAKDPMMGQEPWSKDFSEENNLMPNAKSCKMLKKWLLSYTNICLIDQSHLL